MPELMNTIMADGPSSNPQQPVKAQLRAWGTWVEGIITAFLSNGGLIYASKASLDADLAHAANSMAWVIGDATVANNGIYRKIGASGAGSWTRVADLPYSYIKATDAGAGTPNAIIATSSIPLPTADAGALIAFSVFEANTGSPVTVAFNGGATLTIKTSSGNNVVAGGLTAGMVVAGYKSGTTFRLLSDQASAAIQAAAEASATASAASAADAAESALEAAASAASVGPKGPIVILTSGQSNMANRIPLAWTPSNNFQAWNFWAQISADTVVGTAFAQPDATRMGVAFGLCDKIASDTGRRVYLIDVSVGGKAIADWGPAPPTYNFRQAITNNVAAALAALGLDKIDMFFWWQGESDASNANTAYQSNFETYVMDWLKTKTWFDLDTPTFMFGLPPYCESVPGDKYFLTYGGNIKACVAKDPSTRRFISTEGFPISFWDPTGSLPYIHMTADGYREMGEKGARAALYGMYEPVARDLVYNPGNGTMSFGLNGGVPMSGVGSTTDWLFSKGVASAVRFGVSNNGGAVAGAVAVFSVGASAGSWSVTSNDSVTNNFGSIFWGGTNNALIAATNALGTLDFAAGGFTTRLSIRGDGLYMTPGTAAPASLPNGGIAPVFVDAETLNLVGRSGGVNRTKLIRLKPSSGSYSPTYSSLTNLDSAAGFNWRWTRTDDIITVVGQTTQDATAAGAYSYEITLPVNAAANPTFVAGVDCGIGQGENGIVLAVAGANRAKVQGQAVLTTATTHAVMFSYTVAQADG
ncbi:sialate O-acetylesterase [Mesorhizobium sp. AD1-1]|uniref:sialate O-acetylesterase n=1 Tax=Mesorhizobium sp. AD1-1 TaxID=2876621 RepID=UPI001CCB883B|nr:sialate O-acetylesterase [Mesorhizobium sp. AD1-1]MBZ9719091.1 sialate O-acetylesterase [Mesorhizobium sp. AD1-1]